MTSPISLSTPAADPPSVSETNSGRPNGLTDQQIEELLAVAGRRKGDPSMERLQEEVEQFRDKLLQEEIAKQPRFSGNRRGL